MTIGTQNGFEAGVPAHIAAIATYLPKAVLDNAELAALYPEWLAAKILDKTGTSTRHIAAVDETALDLGVAAAEQLCAENGIDQPCGQLLMLLMGYIRLSSAGGPTITASRTGIITLILISACLVVIRQQRNTSLNTTHDENRANS